MTYVHIAGERRSYSGYDSAGEQVSRRGPFLLLGCRFIQPDVSSPGFSLAYECYPETDTPKLWAILRRVALRQCGHFMMGSTRIGSHRFVVSGAYGGDGLPESLNEWTTEDFARWTLAPETVARAYWHPEYPGWNDAGSEYRTVASWATGGALALPARRENFR